eukprot:CAMPEP_0176112812 /NCGR_PEP_ID=MMETSP0120_2-20121206/56656_1 /TAXON_ID=160619 /ORGANISM="Kryptoperidinium foliaceum, Strain CCMP 1326" /LENGTH=549 /DNA_ID=CAMNT_0017447045 /DNA_START=27 /DNA_END=1673 /DNA_ORIENTATION=+
MTSLKEHGFEDIKVIGRGQYGKAHLVLSEKDQRYFIAKTIELTCLSKKERETATQEVELLRRLDHPNIVDYQDNFFMSDTLVIIMQYCEGGDLQTYIKEKNKEKQRIREVQIMNYFVQVLQALQYIHHEKRILHRDLKTSNLFLMQSKQVVKLGDFGISRVLEGSIEAAITVVGTPYYMSPEVCENKPYTFKSDVWSLGCVLYELCMLKHAFSADNLLGLVYKIVSDKYEPIPKMYSSNLNVLIQRMLEKDAEKRPSVRELLADAYVHNFMNDLFAPVGNAQPRVAVELPSPALPRGAREALPPAAASLALHLAAARAPKEAALRRKREAADREAQKLKDAARQAEQNKLMARQMKETQFQSTRLGPSAMSAAAKKVAASNSAAMAAAGGSASPGGTTMQGVREEDEESLSQDEFEDTPPEEVSEDEDYSDDYDEYEDDFASDDSEGGGSDIEEVLPPHLVAAGGDTRSREEQDFTRVMANYEQDISRTRNDGGDRGTSPTRRSPMAAAPSGSPASAGGGGAKGGAIMDMKARQQRCREDLIARMGADT